MLQAAILSRSLKENERRVAIHPDHLAQIPEALRRRLVFETGYGQPFGLDDRALADQAGGVADRDALFQACDLVVLPKPMHADVERMRPGQALWGWCHLVQDPVLTQMAIDKRLTMITWEGMNTWGPDGRWLSHIFARNNEIAGYAGVLHATGLLGITGHYGPGRKVVVINYGSVSRGAVRALQALGYGDITVLTRQDPSQLRDVPPHVAVRRMDVASGGRVMVQDAAGNIRPIIDELSSADIIVNGILQDPDAPLMFVQPGEQDRLKPGSLILDISCDRGMGFPFAEPTTFGQPLLHIGPVTYYAVDHTPSYLWNGASWEISTALLPFLPTVLAGPDAWQADPVIRPAIEVLEGRILNDKILSFQKRR